MEVEDENSSRDSGRALKPASAPQPQVEKWSKKLEYLDDVVNILR